MLIDVREPYEFAAGHIKGAVNVPLGQLPEKLGGLDPQAETYIICQSGHRSARGASCSSAQASSTRTASRAARRRGGAAGALAGSQHKLRAFTPSSCGPNTL